MKVLQVINTAYRATIEEQDDTVVWLTHAMTGAGGDFDLLLTGEAVNYTVARQDASGLAFGDWQQTEPPRLARDIGSLPAKGVRVFVLDEDAEELGLPVTEQMADTERVSREELADLYGRYEQIWHW